ncbi:MAG: VPLPA-CTERM sorting domain-containing protein [Gammaproteobacteria bacterium]|nr:VPLPA-CTERM sorting domain-containing protein [Gammaproteobacteria bacterium]
MKVPSLTTRKLGVASLAISSLLVIPQVQAADWLCAGSNTWGTSSCWTSNAEPALGDDARITVSDTSDVTVDYIGSVYAGTGHWYSDLIVNNSSTGDAIFNQFVNNELNVNLAIFGTDGKATVNHSAGFSNISYAILGSNYTAQSTYNLSGTAEIESAGFYVGSRGQAVMTQSGGALSVANEFSIGHENGGNGEYNLSSGNLNVAGTEYVGYFGNGVFNQTGGTHTVNELFVGRKNVNGTYNMNGGDLNVTSSLEIGTIPGEPGSGVQNASFVQNSGNVTLAQPDSTVTISSSGMANAQYDLNGGNLTAGTIVNNDTFNYQGGNLNANVDNRDQFNISGGGTRVVAGDFVSRGNTDFQHTFGTGTPGEYTISRTASGFTSLQDATLFSIEGDATFESDSTLAINLTNDYLDMTSPFITVTGDAYVGGLLDLTGVFDSALLENDYVLTLLTASTVYGEFDSVILPGIDNWTWALTYNIDNIQLSAISSVPVPAAAWLFASGLIGLVGVSRRNQKS